MKAAEITEPGSVVISDVEKPTPKDGEVVVRVEASGICGTDIHIYRGEYLGSYPIIPGHEFSGEVTAAGADTSRVKIGDRVAVEPNISCGNCENCLSNRQNFCLNWIAVGVMVPGAMAEYVCVPEEAAFPVGALSYDKAAFVEPLSCVLHGIGKANIDIADRVAILGGGPIGNLLLQCVQLQGASSTMLVEKNDARRDLARQTGADYTYEDSSELGAESCDVVIDASGAFPLMRDAIRIVRKGGTILYFGVPPAEKEMTLQPFTLFEKGITIAASFTSVRNSLQAVALLQTGKIDVGKLISHTLPLSGFQDGMHMIEQGADGVMKVIIQPGLRL